MDEAVPPANPPRFEASVEDFRFQAETFGWTFWRGVLVGFLAGLPLGYIAVIGEGPFGFI